MCPPFCLLNTRPAGQFFLNECSASITPNDVCATHILKSRGVSIGHIPYNVVAVEVSEWKEVRDLPS